MRAIDYSLKLGSRKGKIIPFDINYKFQLLWTFNPQTNDYIPKVSEAFYDK